MGKIGLIAAALAAALSMACGAAQASPLSSSDAIRSERDLAEANALVFDLRREVTAPGKPDQVTEQVVTLAPSFSYVVEGEKRVLEDHALCRSLSWTERARTFDNTNCIAAVAFRVLELQNRQVLSRVIAKADLVDAPQYLAMSETELGVQAPNSPRLESRKTAGGVEYRAGKTVMARVEGSAGEVTPDEMRRVVRFLARSVRMHPQVRRELAASGRLPAVIVAETGQMKAGERRDVLKISNIRHARVAYPLPPGLSSALAEEAARGDSPRGLALRRVQAVIDGKAPRPTAAATLAAIRKAAGQGQSLDVVMLFLEFTQEQVKALQPGDPEGARRLAELRALVGPHMRAADVAALMDANRLAGDAKAKGDRQAAARYLALTPELAKAPFGTFRNVTYANLVATTPDAKDWDPAIRAAMPADRIDNYWIHIAAYPWSSNTYKDVGDAYYGGYDSAQAWMAFDLGRAVDPDWRLGVMAGLAQYETTLRTGEPDFF